MKEATCFPLNMEPCELWDMARTKAGQGDVDFSGWSFPDDPEQKWFHGITFKGETNFTAANFEKGNFHEAIFTHLTYFTDTVFKNASFAGATFEAEVFFDDMMVDGVADFYKTVFQKGVYIDHSILKGEAVFMGAKFCDSATFRATVFCGEVNFQDVTFGADVLFDHALSTCCPVLHVSRNMEKVHGIDGLLRLVRVSAHNCGNYHEESKFYYLERHIMNRNDRSHAKGYKKVRPYVEWFMGEWMLGYGEKPLRPLLWALALILTFAVVFDCWDMAADKASSFGDYLYFSIVTFTTLGYGDMNPGTESIPRLFAASEALLGVTMMSLFLVVLARRYIR